MAAQTQSQQKKDKEMASTAVALIFLGIVIGTYENERANHPLLKGWKTWSRRNCYDTIKRDIVSIERIVELNSNNLNREDEKKLDVANKLLFRAMKNVKRSLTLYEKVKKAHFK
jgi:hypothetical protein